MRLHYLAGLKRVHFVGIGGAGMSGIAEILLDYDIEVTGSDLQDSETTRRLRSLGVGFSRGHDAGHVHGADLVVVSSAVTPNNVELRAALDEGITVARRAEVLAELMRLKYGIAVAGTHGKTTTTSLVGTVLTELGLDPTVIVGGRLRVSGTGARHGKSDYLVAEADEFDRSFLRLIPILATITNIDEDHLDTYGSLDEIKEAFVNFASRVPFFGRVIVCLDDENVQEVLPRLSERRVITYGLNPQAELVAVDVRSEGEGTTFAVEHAVRGRLGEVTIPLPGLHNVRNALAAIAIALTLELPFEDIAKALSRFGGVHRRFERLGSYRGATVVDDYAHHPTEVQATLEAARSVFDGRVHAVFQPHLYSRTQEKARDFGKALMLADSALVLDIYGSRESPIEGVDAELVVRAARDSGHRRVAHCSGFEEAARALGEDVKVGDAIVTLGAGDVYQLARLLVAESRPASASPGGGA